MKKLLAAVTSVVMSASFATSAFASSITVSAAGGVSAVQPNVSMGEVLDGSANKNVQADFIVTAPDITVKPGDAVEVEFKVNSGSHKAVTINTKIGDMPAGITYSMDDPSLYCFDFEPQPGYSKVGDEYHAAVLQQNGDASSFNDSEPVMVLNLKVPANATPGKYEYGLDFFHVVEVSGAGDPPVAPVEFDATVKKGTITISDGGSANPGTDPGTNPGSRPETGDYDDFVITGQDITLKPGETKEMEFYAKANGHKVVLAQCEIDFPSQLDCDILNDPSSYAFAHEPVYTALDDANTKFSLSAKDPQTSDASPVDESQPIAIVSITAPQNVADGTYYVGFKSYHIVEVSGAGVPPVPAVEFEAKVVYGAVTIGDSATTTASTPSATTTKSTTTASNSNTPSSTTTASSSGTTKRPEAGDYDDFVITGQDITLKPGESKEMEFYATANGHKVVLIQAEIDFPSQLGCDLMNDPSSYAFAHEPAYTAIDDAGTTFSLSAKDPQTAEASPVDESQPIAIVNVTAPKNAASGTYYVGFKSYHVVEVSGAGVPPVPAVEFEAKVIYGAVTIVDGDEPTPTTSQSAETTKATTTTKSTSTAAPTTSKEASATTTTKEVSSNTPSTTTKLDPAKGRAEWVIDTVNVKATPGGKVEVKVYVNGDSDLAVAGASYKINAEKVGFDSVSEKSDAYGAAIVNNAQTNEFAFAGDNGSGSTASDKANIMTLTYILPADVKNGDRYPVKWSDAFISDENGNNITSNVTLTDGVIIVDEIDIDGDISWVIPEKHAVPGEEVKVEVKVNVGSKNVAVAGAQFAITPSGSIKTVSASDSVYAGAEAAYNRNTNEFAVANIVGIEAADNSDVIVITYAVPEDIAPGRYPLTWSDEFVCDVNGSEITNSIDFVDGAIIIDDIDGELSWVIPEVHAQPGDKVEMDVKVNVGDKNVAVAGAQFIITAKSPIEFSTVSGSTAYDSLVVNNKDTNEFAFAKDNGAGIEAADGSVVLHLEYLVPDTTAPGEYPVTWSDAFISDENGRDITSYIKFIDGVIIIDPVTTTSEKVITATTTEKTWETTDGTATTSDKESGGVTTTSSVASDVPETSTAPVVTEPVGGIIWDIEDEVPAKPGDEVSVKVIVIDRDGSKLPIGGAQYVIKAESPIEYGGCSDSSDAYGAPIISNPDTNEFAFANEKGEGTAANDGATVMTLRFKVPENCPAGLYPVTFGEDFSFISSADGLDITDLVSMVAGSILVEIPGPGTTVSSTATTKGSETETTADTTTTKATNTSTVPTTSDLGAGTTGTTTGPVVREGAIIWQIDEKTVNPGDTVEINVVVIDPNDTKLPIGGAQFIANIADERIELIGSNGSDAYGIPMQGVNGNEFAFAHPEGEGVYAEDGTNVITLTYKVPDNMPEGRYVITLDEFQAKDENGVDVTNNILVIRGAINVKLPVTTTAGITTSDNGSGTTVTTSVSEPVTSTSVSDDAPNPPETTTPPAIPDGYISWNLNKVSGRPGEIVELTMIVSNPNGTKLDISGAQFILDTILGEGAVGMPVITGAAGTPYGNTLVYNAETGEFAFASTDGSGSASVDGAQMLKVQFQIPENAVPGTHYDVNIANLMAMNEDVVDVYKFIALVAGRIDVIDPEVSTTTTVGGEDIDSTTSTTPTTSDNGDQPGSTTSATPTTSDNGDQPGSTTSTTPTTSDNGDQPGSTTSTHGGAVLPGTDTGTTTTKRPPIISADVETVVEVVDGYYFNHDPRTFKSDHVIVDEIAVEDENGNQFTEKADYSLITFKEAVSGAETPKDAYRKSQSDFTYTINVFYDGQPLMSKGKQVSFTVYIGVKGDTNFDNAVDATDAAVILHYYAEVQTGATNVRLSPEDCAVVNEHPELDELAAFLADVDLDVYSPGNWAKTKAERGIDSSDASCVLAFYAITQTGENDPHVGWNEVFKDSDPTREELFNEYLK